MKISKEKFYLKFTCSVANILFKKIADELTLKSANQQNVLVYLKLKA